MSRKTITHLEAELTQLEAAIRASARDTMNDPDLSPEGRTNRHAAWGRERKWADQFDATANGMLDALNAAQDKADKARATMTTLPAGDAALAAEMRFQRRRARVDAALASGGTGPLLDLIATADDTELPVMLEYVSDHYAATGGDAGKAGAEIVDQALRQRSDEYDRAVKVAGQAANAATVARERIEYVGRLLADPATPVPGEYALAGMSVSGIGGPEVAALAA